MPSPKDKGRDDAPVTGFEALDVKAEALEAEAAEIEAHTAELVSGTVAPPVIEAPAEMAPPAELFAFTPPAARPAGVESLLTSGLRCGQSALHLQVEALGALRHARGPQDVLAVQMDFSRKLFDVYLSETKSAAATVSKLLTGRALSAA